MNTALRLRPFSCSRGFSVWKSIFDSAVSDTWLVIRALSSVLSAADQIIGQAITWLGRTASLPGWLSWCKSLTDQLIYTVLWKRPKHVLTLALSLALGCYISEPNHTFQIKTVFLSFSQLKSIDFAPFATHFHPCGAPYKISFMEKQTVILKILHVQMCTEISDVK